MSNNLPESTCVPQITKQSEDCFVSKELITPWSDEIHDCEVITSALKFNRPIDVMGLSTIDNLLMTGVQDMTDSIDARALITVIYYKKTDESGNVTVQHTDNYLALQFVKPTFDKSGSLVLDKKIQVIVGPDKLPVTLHIVGQLNVMTARLEVSCTSSSDSIEPLGYTPWINRINLNRR